MILVIGGTCQGKLAFAVNMTGCAPGDVCTPGGIGEETAERFCRARVVNGLHRLFREDADRGRYADALMADVLARVKRENPSLVIICDEVGNGIVPADPFERDWRERTGRWMTRIAAECSEVYRVICGIPVRIK